MAYSKGKMILRFSLLLVLITTSCDFTFGQYIPVGSPVLEDYSRRMQLAGALDSTISFTVRPVSSIPLNTDELNYAGMDEKAVKIPRKFAILPFSLQQQYLTHHPYSWNDGLMITAKGYQTMASGGVYAKFGRLSIQLRPEVLYAENSDFQEHRSSSGRVDLPERFGNKSFTQFSWGQSNIRINAGPVSLGLSNENLWWGPGMRNSLLMSNNAPGFKHLTLNTIRPVSIGIGTIESQIIAGRLEGSDYTPGLSDDWRYLSGMVISYNPKWLPGLFLGLTRAFQQYGSDERSFNDYFPIFQPFQKKNTNEDAVARDQLTSVFLRWMMQKSKSEVYLEYGLNDHSYDIRDFLMAPEHARAYTIGFRKLVPIAKPKWNCMSIGVEITHMEQSIDRIVRGAGEWYTHHQIRHGYTNRGQILGAGIGPGGNIQSLDISLYKGLRRFGIQAERYEHNGDLADLLNRGQWIDFSIAGVTDWTYKRFLLSGKLQGIQSNNYQWNSGVNGTAESNLFNLNIQLGITYSF